MSSATINRPSGSIPNTVRSTRFGEFSATANRSINNEENISQNPSLGQGFGKNTWPASSGIWSSKPIGSGFPNSKIDNTRSTVGDDGFEGTTGSGALAASSEADTWVSRNGPWHVDTTSPTLSASGSTSPIRHRGSGPIMLSESQKTSPYMTTSRPAIGQGPGITNRSQAKSSLDPASGSFKYPFNKPVPYGFPEDKENNREMNGLEHYGGHRSNGATPRDNSQPSSRSSETAPTGPNGSFFTNGGYPPSFGHTPNNSIHIQRPSAQGRNSSFLSNGRSFADLTDQAQEPELNFRELQLQDKEAFNSNTEQPYTSPGAYSNYSSQHTQLNGTSAMWNNGTGSSSKNASNYSTEGYADVPFSDQLNSSRVSRAGDRGSLSPSSDFRRLPTSPKFYSLVGTPPVEIDPGFARGIRPQAAPELDRGFQRLQFSQPQPYFPPPLIYNGQFQGQYQGHAYDYPQNFRPTAQQYGYQIPIPPYTAALGAPRGPARDQDVGHGVRSALLEEFRSNSKSNKRYELKDIYGHVVEFSGDQHGSRFIQQKLETANSDEKDQIFREIQPNALQLMTDVFGNYVIQKLFEHGNQVQKRVLAEQMRNHVNELSIQMYGCRVVQKALEHVLADQQAELVKELQADVLKCVKDQNGNHVIQKAIERVPTEHIQFIIEAFKGQVHTLATHPYGCRVIQRMLEYCSEQDQAVVLEELHACAAMLITDQYGNYVTQHVIQHGKPEDRAKIIKIVTAQLLTLSKHKFASNVVEKSIQFGTDEQRRAIVAQLTALHSDGSSPLQLMMKDQYGNYVIQKLLAQLKGAERERFVEDMKPQLVALKKYNYGKQIAAIEKLIYTSAQPPHQSQVSSYSSNLNMVPSTVSKTLPLDINSTVPTPMLTMEQNSPQSSSLPSTNASTVDGPTEPADSKTVIGKSVMPEVRIETA